MERNIGHDLIMQSPTVINIIDDDQTINKHILIVGKWYIEQGFTINEYDIPDPENKTEGLN